MVTEEEIRKAFFEYAAHNELLAIYTPGFYARQILPDASFYAKANVIQDLIDNGIMVIRGDRCFIKK
jgi:hypothetical protein